MGQWNIECSKSSSVLYSFYLYDCWRCSSYAFT